MDKIVGRVEKISFPEIGVMVDAKVDTGAYNISLHVDEFVVMNDELALTIGDKTYFFNDFKEIQVKSSFGETQNRFYIRLRMKLGRKIYKVFVSVSNRKNMKYPCLIGRKFINSYGFLVDVRKKFVNDTVKKV